MKPVIFCTLPLLALAATLRPASAPAAEAEDVSEALARYVAKNDTVYNWTEKQHGKVGTVDYTELILTSQTWQGITWKHQLFVIKPSSTPADAKQALLVIAGGTWKDRLENPDADRELPREAPVFAALAEQLRTPVAVLLQVPFQPVFDGLVEDQIISLTFEKYLRTGDPEWPLLLPMTKAAVRGMDAVQEFTKQEWSLEIENFTVTGASKRGWTTWLTGAVDDRVTAIAPMVIDVLNMSRHLEHQREVWGDFSSRIHDYTDRDIPKHMDSPRGRLLRRIVDPYSYVRKLTQPKLLLIGTNDRYWPLDALNLYWNDLRGPKYVLYVPNNRHGLKDLPRVLGTIAALHRHATGELQLPELSWTFDNDGETLSLEIDSDIEPQSVALWTAHSETRDFREAEWTSQPVAGNDGNRFRCNCRVPDSGFTAVFGEAVFADEALATPYSLSTNVRIVEAKAE